MFGVVPVLVLHSVPGATLFGYFGMFGVVLVLLALHSVPAATLLGYFGMFGVVPA